MKHETPYHQDFARTATDEEREQAITRMLQVLDEIEYPEDLRQLSSGRRNGKQMGCMLQRLFPEAPGWSNAEEWSFYQESDRLFGGWSTDRIYMTSDAFAEGRKTKEEFQQMIRSLREA